MKTCRRCNTINDDTARYCRSCGELLNENNLENKPNKDVNGWWYVLAFVLFLLWLALKTKIISF